MSDKHCDVLEMNYSFRMDIVFSKPRRLPAELGYIEKALAKGNSAGGGEFSQWCSDWLKNLLNSEGALLTNSATDALEMAALLLNIMPGDEIIMPSFTFSSCANAFVLRGAKPIFVDVDPETMNIKPEDIIGAISPRTRVLLVVHYAGISCDMRAISEICKTNDLTLVEDAAQALMSKFEDRYLGTFGDLSCFSFHATKNIVSGEGGALVINNPNLLARAKILLEKGTNREQFLNGEIDKYSWVDLGSSYLPSELSAAFLKSQIEAAGEITEYRIANWRYYFENLVHLADELSFSLINPSEKSHHNGHIFFLILENEIKRSIFMSEMKAKKIHCATHYVPLHNSKAGIEFGGVGSSMQVTEDFSGRLVRLPMWSHENMPIERILETTISTLKNVATK